MIAVTVQAGDTLSGIAAAHGESLAQVEADNPQFSSDFNLIMVGQQVNLSGGGTGTITSAGPSFTPSHTDGDGDHDGDTSDAPAQSAPVQHTSPSSTTFTPTSGGGVGSTPASGISIPGMPQSLANCIWFRESTNGTNPAAGGNQFGIIPASGFNVAGDSVAQQEQVAGQIFAQSGGAAWAADGCPGT
jgi:LysM domain